MRKSKVPEKKNGADASSTSNFSEITHPSEFDSRSKNKKGEPVLALWQPKKVEKSKYRSDNEESLSSTASIADYENYPSIMIRLFSPEISISIVNP